MEARTLAVIYNTAHALYSVYENLGRFVRRVPSLDKYGRKIVVFACKSSFVRCAPLAVMAMWHKPCATYPLLYPSANDENGQPLVTRADPERRENVCSFLAVTASRSSNQTRKSTLAIINILKDRFSDTEEQKWETFFAEDPKEAQYTEVICYVNAISSHSATDSDLCGARTEAKDMPILEKGSTICVLPPADVLADLMSPVGEQLPFWIGCILENKEAPTGARVPTWRHVESTLALHVAYLVSQTRMENVFNLHQRRTALMCSCLGCSSRTIATQTASSGAGNWVAHSATAEADIAHGTRTIALALDTIILHDSIQRSAILLYD
eukprot:6172147-Pleurochrysis_carterae.AAC.2